MHIDKHGLMVFYEERTTQVTRSFTKLTKPYKMQC